MYWSLSCYLDWSYYYPRITAEDMSAHPHQTRGTVRLVNPMGGAASMAGGHLQPPPPTPILRPTEVKRQFQEHADFATYSKAIKKYLNGGITKTEFHAELSKVLPTKEKSTPFKKLLWVCVCARYPSCRRCSLAFGLFCNFGLMPPFWRLLPSLV